MSTSESASNRHVLSLAVILAIAALLRAGAASGQGCSPSRFASPARFGQGDVYLPRGTWQVGLAFRRLTSHNLIQGHDDNSVTAPHGDPSAVESQTLVLSVEYAVSDRLSLTLNAPFLYGSHTTWYADSLRHTNTAAGLGETTLLAIYWLRRAQAVSPGGNVSVGLGVKAPTGKNDVQGTWWNKNGSTVPFPVHQSIQLGDGGWGLILQVMGFQPILDRAYLYAAGTYTINPKKTTDVVRSPGSTVHWAVPDTWSANAGIGVALWPEQGLTGGLNARLGGTTQKDLLGGKDDGFRLPAATGYFMPNLTLARGRHMIEAALPVLVYRNFPPSDVDLAAGKLGGGGLAKYAILVGYSVRF
jgi:hypothetical protein